jgi:methylated-DNA-[protein]-cysteine S-methyltransferase
MTIRWAMLDSPLGPVRAVAADTGLRELAFDAAPADDGVEAPEAFGALHDALEAYFLGERVEFDLAVDPQGSPFQRRVWEALRRIPWGSIRAYGQIAEAIGRPGAARAVGGAIGRNPVAIVIPCHRVLGADGSLTGYASGLDRKRHLLALEGLARDHAPGHAVGAHPPTVAALSLR